MRKSFLLGMAIFVLTLATQPSFADTIAYSPSSIVNACFEVNALNIPEDISTDAGRSESEADKPNGLKWAGAIDQFAPGTGLQELFAQRGIE
ncbi:MAG TPA: hypothetical protein VEF04_13455, partial [Blastocatellia bacterium]|nr:hypothetical protein [Blastocatellia bacterium]